MGTFHIRSLFLKYLKNNKKHKNVNESYKKKIIGIKLPCFDEKMNHMKSNCVRKNKHFLKEANFKIFYTTKMMSVFSSSKDRISS